jgi:hypothetical protein
MQPLAVIAFTIFYMPCFAGIDDPIQKKLDEANTSYEAKIKKAEGELSAAFDDRAENARKAGNFGGVKRAKAEKEAFEKEGTPPILASMRVPFATYQRAIKQADLEVEAAYKKAIQDYTKANLLDIAEATNAGLVELKKRSPKTTADPAKTVWLSDLTEFDVKVAENRFAKSGELGFTAAGFSRIRFQGRESPHGISMNPVPNNFGSVKFELPNNAETFMASAALNDTAAAPGAPPGVGRIATRLTFQVLGDDKVLWESKPIDTARKSQECKIAVSGVKTLELRINCPGSYVNAHAVWLEPRILLK